MNNSNNPIGPVGAQAVPAQLDEQRQARYRNDFEEKYPPDLVPGEELADRARVWRVYRGEAIEHDDALLKSWNDTVNILLTFAGLFSAAVTSFVVASTDDLKADPNAYVANVLFAILNATSADAAAVARLADAAPTLVAVPSRLSRIVNGLWFTSLFLSLAAALLCILVKQWLDEYLAHTRSSAKHPHRWAQRRSFYFQGLNAWNLPAIISFLPLLLHLALFLFLAGLAVFLWDLDNIIRWVLLGLVGVLGIIYMGTFILPLWNASCPYATPLLNQLLYLLDNLHIQLHVVLRWIYICNEYFRTLKWGPPRTPDDTSVWLPLVHRVPYNPNRMKVSAISWSIRKLRERTLRRPFDRLYEMENETTDPVLADRLDYDALKWLFHEVSDSDALATAWQSLGALLAEPYSPRATLMRAVIRDNYLSGGGDNQLWMAMRIDGASDDLQLGRLVRSWVCMVFSLTPTLGRLPIISMDQLPASDVTALRITRSPDAALIYALSQDDIDFVRSHIAVWVSAHSPIVWTAARLLPYSEDPEWIIALLLCSGFQGLTILDDDDWSHAARCLVRSKTGQRFTCVCPEEHCDIVCVVNNLAQRVVLLEQEEMTRLVAGQGQVADDQSSFTSFDKWSHVRLIAHIMSLFRYRRSHLPTSPAVAVALSFRQNWLRITPDIVNLWPQALAHVPNCGYFADYAAYAVPYLATWRVLASTAARTHELLPVIDNDLRDCNIQARPSLVVLSLSEYPSLSWRLIRNTTFTMKNSPTWRVVLRALLSLLDTLAITGCTLGQIANGLKDGFLDTLLENVQLFKYFPIDLDLTEEERAEWTTLFIRATRHCIALRPSVWKDLQLDVAMSASREANLFFAEVETALKASGRCTEGSCADMTEVMDWPL